MNTLIVGGIDLFKSTNGATSWSQITHWYGGFSYDNVHADQHAIVYKPGFNQFKTQLFIGGKAPRESG